jgi:transcription initiation factor IIE alpha subunit
VTDPEYEVVWNGVNDGSDGDLLNYTARVPQKTMAEAGCENLGPTAMQQVLAVLPFLRLKALDFPQICTLTGLKKQTVNAALYALRNRRLITSENIHEGGERVRVPQRYWRLG